MSLRIRECNATFRLKSTFSSNSVLDVLTHSTHLVAHCLLAVTSLLWLKIRHWFSFRVRPFLVLATFNDLEVVTGLL
jgi:hypothetical protein